MSALPKQLIRDLAANVVYRMGLAQVKSRSRFTIATFHRVLTEAQLAEYPLPELAVSTTEFCEILGFLTTEYTCGTLQQTCKRYQAGERPRKPLLALTFDDGQQDNFDNAVPILDRYGALATFFVAIDGVENQTNLWHDNIGYAYTSAISARPMETNSLLRRFAIQLPNTTRANVRGIVDQAKHLADGERLALETELVDLMVGPNQPAWDGIMSWQQLQNLLNHGHEIGSHTFSHPILPNCTAEKIFREVSESKQTLEQELDTPIKAFCYPNGDYNEVAIAAVREAGYQVGVSTNWGLNNKHSNLFALNRCDIQSNTSRSTFGLFSRARLALRLSGLQPGL